MEQQAKGLARSTANIPANVVSAASSEIGVAHDAIESIFNRIVGIVKSGGDSALDQIEGLAQDGLSAVNKAQDPVKKLVGLSGGSAPQS